MDLEVKMPDLSTTGGDVIVTKWLVNTGESVERGQPLFEVETDKATMEVEAIAAGVLKQQCAVEGASITVGETVAVLEVSRPNSVVSQQRTEKNPAEPTSSTSVLSTQAEISSVIKQQPAQRRGGMFQRNKEAAQSRAAKTEHNPLSESQLAVGRRMQASKQTIPHFYLQTSVNAEPMITRRSSAEPTPPAWDAFFVCAVAKALQKFPQFTCRILGSDFRCEPCDTVGVAVDIDNELHVVPIVEASTKTPEEVSSTIRHLVQELRDSGAPAKLQPADITVTNLGMMQVETFSPIINPPEAAILGIGRITPQAIVVGGAIVVEHRVSVTLSVDHRVANGKSAAQFLGSIIDELESV